MDAKLAELARVCLNLQKSSFRAETPTKGNRRRAKEADQRHVACAQSPSSKAECLGK